jgi:hypothetical protein
MVNVSLLCALSRLANGGAPFADEQGALMGDFGDEKAMARTVRDALKAKTVETTHAEALELAELRRHRREPENLGDVPGAGAPLRADPLERVRSHVGHVISHRRRRQVMYPA